MEHGQIALIGWSCAVGGVRRALQDGQGRLWLLFGFIPLTQALSLRLVLNEGFTSAYRLNTTYCASGRKIIHCNSKYEPL
jgi:hypothetical protein